MVVRGGEPYCRVAKLIYTISKILRDLYRDLIRTHQSQEIPSPIRAHSDLHAQKREKTQKTPTQVTGASLIMVAGRYGLDSIYIEDVLAHAGSHFSAYLLKSFSAPAFARSDTRVMGAEPHMRRSRARTQPATNAAHGDYLCNNLGTAQ
jgi:hypothetical protein